MADSYPLHWPPGWPRTKSHSRDRARFGQQRRSKSGYNYRSETTFHNATTYLYQEIERLGAESAILSSNLNLKLDGIPYANQKRPEDPGVAVYFKLNNTEQCIPCDKWDRPEDNIKAIGKTIEALRGIERWGAKEMVNAAFRGFRALPDPADVVINYIQYFADCQSKEQAKPKYRQLVKELHPDMGGDPDAFNEMKRQYDQLQ